MLHLEKAVYKSFYKAVFENKHTSEHRYTFHDSMIQEIYTCGRPTEGQILYFGSLGPKH